MSAAPPKIARLDWHRQPDGTYHALPTKKYLLMWEHRAALEAVGFGRKWDCHFNDRRITFDPKVASPEEVQRVVDAAKPPRRKRGS